MLVQSCACLASSLAMDTTMPELGAFYDGFQASQIFCQGVTYTYVRCGGLAGTETHHASWTKRRCLLARACFQAWSAEPAAWVSPPR